MAMQIVLVLLAIQLCLWAAAAEPVQVGSRLELLIDDSLVEKWKGDAGLRLHHPTPREVVMVHDAAWEGSGCGYHTIFKDGDIFRMYYKAWHLDVGDGKLVQGHGCFGAYAESRDGIRWTKPNLGLFEFNGSKKNNLVWFEYRFHFLPHNVRRFPTQYFLCTFIQRSNSSLQVCCQ